METANLRCLQLRFIPPTNHKGGSWSVMWEGIMMNDDGRSIRRMINKSVDFHEAVKIAVGRWLEYYNRGYNLESPSLVTWEAHRVYTGNLPNNVSVVLFSIKQTEW